MDNYVEFFNSLPLYYEDESFIYVHGGIRPGVSMQHQVEDDLLWIREEFFYSPKTFEKPVIFGHTPTKYITGSWAPYIKKDRIGIDTGVVFGGSLTAIEISHGEITEIYQVAKLVA
ncbi:hypothetical protein JOC73_002736 [Alkaliphilus hydrothermalis]|uniref:Serine/threonine protein phosphatase 1 n=1 Tax=Alkaliphilus hydrothermalis TaxID=1482730 RepID=A0ABS2NT66_9FIRM|nr:hypothetical protein [Alkaliphilus hydrothermalis]